MLHNYVNNLHHSHFAINVRQMNNNEVGEILNIVYKKWYTFKLSVTVNFFTKEKKAMR